MNFTETGTEILLECTISGLFGDFMSQEETLIEIMMDTLAGVTEIDMKIMGAVKEMEIRMTVEITMTAPNTVIINRII
jgi:hypothetical protein